MLIYTRHDVIFAMIYSPMWVNRVACIAQKCETLIARKYPFNETSEMIYVADDVLFTTAATSIVHLGDSSHTKLLAMAALDMKNEILIIFKTLNF